MTFSVECKSLNFFSDSCREFNREPSYPYREPQYREPQSREPQYREPLESPRKSFRESQYDRYPIRS